MIKEPLLILDADKAFARKRIQELEDEIQALGQEFYEVFNQSSETWHDNAPFDALRDRQSVMAAELQTLKRVMRESAPSVPKGKKNAVHIGSTVKVQRINGKVHSYLIAGDWTPHAGHSRDGVIVVSRKTPIAQLLLGKKVGDQIDFNGPTTITTVS